MTVFWLTLVVMGLAIVGMALGTLMGRNTLKSGCHSLRALDTDLADDCPVCSGSCRQDSGEPPSPDKPRSRARIQQID